MPLVYDELRKLAAAKLGHERPGQTLQSTTLVEDDRPLLALANIAANLLAGLFAVWLGIMAVKLWS